MEFQVRRQKVDKPPRILFHAPAKKGKTTLLTTVPKSIIIALESGAENHDAAQFPQPRSWEELLAQVNQAASMDEFQVISIDTATEVVNLAKRTIEERTKKHVKGVAWSLVYNLVKDFVDVMDEIREEKNKAFVIAAHSRPQQVNDPRLEEPYYKWVVDLKSQAHGYFTRWVDMILFANDDITAVPDSNTNQVVSSGMQFFCNHNDIAYESGGRISFPDQADFTWSSISQAFKAARKGE